MKKESALVSCEAAHTVKAGPDPTPVSSKLPQTPLATPPPSNSIPKQISYLSAATERPTQLTPAIVITPMTPPASPTTDKFSAASNNKSVLRQQQLAIERPKRLPAAAALLSQLFSKGKERAINRCTRAGYIQANLRKDAKEVPASHSNEENGDNSDSDMGSLEVAAMRRQQNQRLRRKEIAAPADFEINGMEPVPDERIVG